MIPNSAESGIETESVGGHVAVNWENSEDSNLTAHFVRAVC